MSSDAMDTEPPAPGMAEIQDDPRRQAIMQYQTFFHLPLTGVLDDATKEMMRQPRCGNPEFTIHEPNGRKKRYALEG